MADYLFTQEELNSKIAQEKRAYQEKLEAKAKELEAKAKALEESAAKVLEAERRANIAEVSAKYRLDEDVKEFLTASDKEELDRQAKKLAEKITGVPTKKAGSENETGGWTTRPSKAF